MNWREIKPKIASMKDGLRATMAEVRRMAGQQKELPKPDSSFDTAQRIFDNEDYDVVVCGEVKKGKSSFINAIIGDNVLPVNSDIATSQVFRLSNSPIPSFKLVFTDGSTKPISREELSTYGSQVEVTTEMYESLGGKTISYIEVNVPAAFLPDGVHIVDTPGLGAIHKTHEYITQGYIKKASAVVFVLDYDRPIVDLEKTFIHKVLGVTKHVLFVITKTDLYDEDVRRAIISRDEEILSDIFREHNLPAPRIYPVSSTSLMGASTRKIEQMRTASYNSSGYNEVESQLMKMIYRAVGLLRTDVALSASVNYVNRVNSVIGDMLKACKADSQTILKQVEDEKRKRQQEFQDRWNEQGRKRNSIKDRINQLSERFVADATILVSSNGELYRSYLNRIDALCKDFSLGNIKSIAVNLPKDFAQEIPERWRSLAEGYLADVRSIMYEVDSQMSRSSYDSTTLSDVSASGFTTSDWLNVSRSAAGGGLVTIAVLNLLFNPVLWVTAVVGIIATFVFGFDAGLNRLKNKTKEKLNDILSQASRQIPQYARDMATRVRSEAMNSLQESFTLRKDEIQDELNAIQERGKMAMTEKQQEFDKWSRIKSQWDAETGRLRNLIEDRKGIVRMLNE